MSSTNWLQLFKSQRPRLAAAVAAVVVALSPFSTPARAEDKPITVGFVYVGSKDDYGYNQSHAEAAKALKDVPGVKVIEQENVPETVAVEKAMESMVKQGDASIIFATSYGYFDPAVLKQAKKLKNVDFFHCGGRYVDGTTPENISTYFGYIDECEYLAGIIAAHTSKTGKLGFIAAKPIPQVLRDINAYESGAKSVNPKVTTTVIFTGDWFLPVKEAEAANSLIGQGIDVLTCHVDSPKVIMEQAEHAGVYCTGYHSNGSPLAPKGYLTGAEWNWATPVKAYVDMVRSGKPFPHTVRGGLKEGFVKMSDYGPAVSDDAKKDADAAKAKFLGGDFAIFKGPLKDNTGKDIYPAGETHVQTDPVLEGMNYLVEGVVGKAP